MISITTDQHKIIDSAFKLFSKHGPEKTTMAQIARDLGYSRTFLYYYFPDKESIFKMALIRCAEKYFESVKGELKRKITGAQMLENSVKTKVICARDFQVLGVYSNMTMYNMLLQDPDLQYIFSYEHKLLREIIQTGKRDGSLVKCNAAKTAQQITEGLIGYMSLGLRRLGSLDKIGPSQMNVLLKRQLDFGAMLVNSIKSK